MSRLARVLVIGSLLAASGLRAETPTSAPDFFVSAGYGHTVRIGPANSEAFYATVLPQLVWTLRPGLQYVVEGHVSRWSETDAWVGGVVPVGLRLGFARSARAAWIGAGLGIAWADLVDLVEIDRRFNFLLQAGVGVPLCGRRGCSWSAEARWLHLSNANTAGRNLGLNSVVVLAGFRP